MQIAQAVPDPVGDLPVRLDRTYELVERLHTGGMGQIFRAVRLLDRGVVALKLVLPSSEVDAVRGVSAPSYRLALALEFQTLASLHHPNIIRVQSYGFDHRYGPYFTMDLLEGAPTIVEAAAGRDDAGRVELAAQLLRALSYIHRRGVLHRDIKPANVLVRGGEVKLLDFGLATEANRAAGVVGTWGYMAPELFEGVPPSVASDLFSVGVLLHNMFAGGAPDVLRGTHANTVGLVGEEVDAEGPTVAGGAGPMGDRLVKVQGPLEDVVRTLLRRRPGDRYPDAEATLRALAAAVGLDIPFETAQTRESFLQATVLVGRDAELAELLRALDRSRDGHGSIVMVAGESGVGKSRLLAEVRTLALVYGHWAAIGQSVSEGGRHYDEWLPLLRELCLRVDVTDDEASALADLVPDLERLLGRKVHGARPAANPDEAQARIATTVADMLARLSRPMLLVLEDLQWARAESVGLLARLSQRIEALPVLLLGSYRSEEAAWLLAAAPRAEYLALGRLDRDGIVRLATSMLGETGRHPDLVDYLVRQTEGNVFFLIEIVRALAETSGELGRIAEHGLLDEGVLTSGIERIIERRLLRVADQWRPLLDFAATLGRRLDLRVLAHAFPTTSLETGLVECANAAVLESQGSDWRFAHDKLREALLRRLAPEQRRELHQRVAYALEAVYPAAEREPLAAMFAHHFAQAGLAERALPFYLCAGDQAVRLSLWDEARQHFAGAQAALEQLPDGEDHRRMQVDLLLRQMYTTFRTEKLEVQLARYDQGHAILKSLQPTSGPSAEDRLRLARLDCYRGHALYYGGQPAEAIRFYERVLPAAREADDQELLMLPANMIAASLAAQGNMGQAEALFAQAVAPLERYANTYDWMRCHLLHAVSLVATGSFQGGIERMLDALADVERLDRTALLALVWVALGPAYRIAGEWPRMLEAARFGIEFAQRSGEQMHLYMGWNEEAWALAHLGRHAEAADSRAQADELARKLGGKLPYSDWFEAGNAEQDLLAGRYPEAIAIATALVEKARAMKLVLSRGIAERVHGFALARLGADLGEVEDHIQESLRVLEGGRNVLDCAHTELWWGKILRDRGEHERASGHLAAARAVFERSGCGHALAEVERVARRA